MTKYVTAEPTDEGTIMLYPADKPYVMRDQGLHNSDELCWAVISDAYDVIRAAASEEIYDKVLERGLDVASIKLQKLSDEAYSVWKKLNAEGSEFDSSIDPGAMQWLLEEAENTEHVSIQFNGDAGTVWITVSDYWEEQPDWLATKEWLESLEIPDRQRTYVDNLVGWINDNCYLDY